MASVRPAIAALATLIATAGCVHQDQTVDTYFPEPTVVAGPPGGGMDPSWNAGYPAEDPSNVAAYGEIVASADPAAPGYVMGTVTDVEISATLEGYGEWITIDGYGDVWRPYATTVGLDFTPYETCGSWVWTDDWGWVYGCDWEWGWLPFHYGQWGWFEDYWAWVPGYEWTPAACEWRGGGGYVGWRPQPPVVRDHRYKHNGPTVRDHRSQQGLGSVARRATLRASHWRFASTVDFGKRNIRAHLMKNPAEGLAVTTLSPRPPITGTVQPVKAASVMRGRLASLGLAGTATRSPRTHSPLGPGGAFEGAYVRGVAPGRVTSAPGRHTPSFGADESDDNAAVFAPGAAGTEGSPVRGGLSGTRTDDVFQDDMRSGGPSNVPDELDPSTPATPQPDPSGWDVVNPSRPSWDRRSNDSSWEPAQPQSSSPTWGRHSNESSTWQPAQPQSSSPTWGRHSNESSTWQPAQPAQPARPSWQRHSDDASSWQPAQPSQPPRTRHSYDSSSWQPAQPAQPSQPSSPTWGRHSSGSSSWQPVTPSAPPSSPPPSPPQRSWPSRSSSSSWSSPSRSSSSSSSPSRSSGSHSSPPSSSGGSRSSSSSSSSGSSAGSRASSSHGGSFGGGGGRRR